MGTKKRFAFNVVMNWAALVVGMVVPFFLTPMVIRSLGRDAYGIWILSASTVSYLNLLDLGLRSAVIRFVSKAHAQGNTQEVRNAIGAALWFRLLIAAGVGIISVGLAYVFPHMFKVPGGLQRVAQITVLLCALGVAITLVSGVFGAVLAAIHRFDVLSTVGMLQTALRAGGIIFIIRSGRGLLSLAVWELAVIVIVAVTTISVSFKLFPESRVRIAKPEIEILKKIWSYSFTTFLLMIAVQVVMNTDNLVIGAFLSVGVVVFYSIGGSLIAYSTQVVSGLSTTFTPLASSMEATGRLESLQKLLIRGTQATLALALPISVTLLLRGKTFIGLWMGQEYSQVSGTVLQILLISQYLSIANGTGTNIAMAVDKHAPAVKAAIVEAALNLGLSILLVKTMGLYGVALGTSISMTIVHLWFWPRYVKKLVDVPIHRYLWEGWGKITLCAIPFGIASALVDRYWKATNLVTFFSQVLVTLTVYAACVLLVFHEEMRSLFRQRFPSKVEVTQ
jgi:O-antigen/teichoic acid export membrane protein